MDAFYVSVIIILYLCTFITNIIIIKKKHQFSLNAYLLIYYWVFFHWHYILQKYNLSYQKSHTGNKYINAYIVGKWSVIINRDFFSIYIYIFINLLDIID